MYQKKTSKQECLVPVVAQQDNEGKLLPSEETCVKEKEKEENEEPMIIDEPLLVCAHKYTTYQNHIYF